MSYVEVLHYHAIWILELHDRRRLSAFSQIPGLTLVRPGGTKEEVI